MEGKGRYFFSKLLCFAGVFNFLDFIPSMDASLQQMPQPQNKGVACTIEARYGPCAFVLSYDLDGNLVNVWEKIWANSRALIQAPNDTSWMQHVNPEYAFTSDHEKDDFEASLERKSDQYVKAWYRLKSAIRDCDLEQVQAVFETSEILELARFQKHLFHTLDDNLLFRLDRIDDQEKKSKLKKIRNFIIKKTGRRHNPYSIKF